MSRVKKLCYFLFYFLILSAPFASASTIFKKVIFLGDSNAKRYEDSIVSYLKLIGSKVHFQAVVGASPRTFTYSSEEIKSLQSMLSRKSTSELIIVALGSNLVPIRDRRVYTLAGISSLSLEEIEQYNFSREQENILRSLREQKNPPSKIIEEHVAKIKNNVDELGEIISQSGRPCYWIGPSNSGYPELKPVFLDEAIEESARAHGCHFISGRLIPFINKSDPLDRAHYDSTSAKCLASLIFKEILNHMVRDNLMKFNYQRNLEIEEALKRAEEDKFCQEVFDYWPWNFFGRQKL